MFMIENNMFNDTDYKQCGFHDQKMLNTSETIAFQM